MLILLLMAFTIANPDLVARYETDAPLNTPDQTTLLHRYGKRIPDYPAMAE
jgi:N-ethylmaleimide reductase